MSERAVDRRVRKTKSALRAALVELMQKKRIQDITVRELADRCDINRGTFYLHYKDVFDMVAQMEKEIMEELEKLISSITPESMANQTSKILEDFFKYLADNAEVAKALMGPHGDLNFFNHLKKLVREKCVYNWGNMYDHSNEAVYEYTASYIVSGTVGMMECWLARGMHGSPKEMAAIATRLIMGDPVTFDPSQNSEASV